MRVVCRVIRVAVVLIGVNAMGTFTGVARQQPDGRTIVAESEAIHTAHGVEVRETVKLGGISQWITVRGKDLNNPLLLYVHGGPGDAIMGVSWSFQRPWEDYFTVVEWDQRGSGKTYASNDWETVEPTMKVERFVDDAEELVQYLRTKYHKRKIVLLGHSWGHGDCHGTGTTPPGVVFRVCGHRAGGGHARERAPGL
jgi:pimeloyl-ACP methyl ester carboxylesterase